MLDQWAYHNGVEIDFSRPGKPTDNAFYEAFNGRVRAEWLEYLWHSAMELARNFASHSAMPSSADSR